MTHNPGRYKPSVCSIDEIDDKNLNSHRENEFNQQQNKHNNQHIEGSETAPLTTNQQKSIIDDNLTPKDNLVAPLSKDGTRPEQNNTCSADGNSSINGFRGRLSFDALMRLSRKRRILYISTACLCALLLVIIILLIAFWPDVPFYLKAELCLEKECMSASQQILLWSNTSKNPCHNSYEWACGNFQHDYEDNNYFVIKKGEWNYQTFNEYQELNELGRFISTLPLAGVSYSVESMISNLYRSCREIDNLDKSQSDLLMKKAIKSVDGWQALRDYHRLQFYDYKKALVYLQVTYGVFPYYRVSVENRFNKPHDYIITLDEGEIGLPDKYFYNVEQNNEITRAYRLLLRDFAINLGMVAREAELFADEIFHYERRIVNHIRSVVETNERNLDEIKTLAEIKNMAPSLPIFETLQALFPHTKITEETEVLVRNSEIFSALSTVVSTSDKKPINSFIIWTLMRHFLPHLSKEYRILVENFDHSVFGRTAAYPRWMVCAKIVRDWLPFAVDGLQQNPRLMQTSPTHYTKYPETAQPNDAFLRLIYHSVRNQLLTAIEEAEWIQQPFKDFINEKFTSMRLQIGVPEEVIQNRSYIEDYYNNLLLNNLFFVEHLESIWAFRRSRMEEKLKSLNIVDTIISELYTNDEPQHLTYSNILNMLIISRRVVTAKYYDYHYPVAVNFARIGVDILEKFLEILFTFVKQFEAENQTSLLQQEPFRDGLRLGGLEAACLSMLDNITDDVITATRLHQIVGERLYTTLSAVKITAEALSTFIASVDDASPIIGASIDENLNYENLGLTHRRRLPGLRSYNDNELFTLAYLQKHCSTTIADKDYARIKPHIEKRLPERDLFKATWSNIQFLPRSLSCSTSGLRCSNIL